MSEIIAYQRELTHQLPHEWWYNPHRSYTVRAKIAE